MLRKDVLIGCGTLLIGVFLTWMLIEGTPPVQAVIDENELLGIGAWALAWACALGGAALIARGIASRRPTAPPRAE